MSILDCWSMRRDRLRYVSCSPPHASSPPSHQLHHHQHHHLLTHTLWSYLLSPYTPPYLRLSTIDFSPLLRHGSPHLSLPPPTTQVHLPPLSPLSLQLSGPTPSLSSYPVLWLIPYQPDSSLPTSSSLRNSPLLSPSHHVFAHHQYTFLFPLFP